MLDRDAYHRQNAERNTKRKKTVREHLYAVITNSDRITQILLTVFTLGLLVVGFLQWCTFKKQWATFEKTDDTLRAGERAFISVTGLEMTRLEHSIRVQISFYNSGATPTVNLKWGGYPRDKNELRVEKENWLPHEFSDADLIQRESLGPKSKLSFPFNLGIDEDDISDIKNGKIFPKFSGKIDYFDTFGDRHQTKFCYRLFYNPEAHPKDVFGYLSCGGNTNCMDEECERKN